MASSRYLQSPVAGDKLSGQEMGRKGESLNNQMMMGRQTPVVGEKLNGLEKGRRNSDLRIIQMKICLAILLLARKPKIPKGEEESKLLE